MSRPSVRPKRAGEEFARTYIAEESESGPSSSKKPRFDLRNPSELAPDELEEDEILDADEIGHRGRAVRRNAVNLDGYQSDSDEDAFDLRAEAKAKAKREEERAAAEDDDMFADLKEDEGGERDEDDSTSRKGKKSVRFLRDDEIVGQVGGSTGARKVHVDLSRPDEIKRAEDAVSESESESDVDDEERARLDENLDAEVGAGGKKHHAPLIDAFNMRAEQEEGRFDEAGNYIRKAADPDAIHDRWLDGVSKKDIRRAKEAAERRENERREKDRQMDSILTSDLLRTLITNLEKGETVLEALARLGKGLKKKPKWQAKKNKKNAQNGRSEDVEMTEEDPQETARRKAIDDITGAANLLLSRGMTDIYDAERELLTRHYRRETGETWVDPPEPETAGETQEGADSANGGTVAWEFRWSDARDGGQVHGPYDSATMQSWRDAGYFGEGVEFRQVGDPDDSWRYVTAFT